MQKLTKFSGLLKYIVVAVMLVISFELGVLTDIDKSQAQLKGLIDHKAYIESSLKITSENLDSLGHELTQAESEKFKAETEYQAKLQQLSGQVAGLSDELGTTQKKLDKVPSQLLQEYPFAIPSSGEIVTFAGMYGGNMYSYQHWGVDIWTTRENNGLIPGYRGNPVYSACDGKVTKMHPGNGAVTILCDNIPRDKGYSVPSYDEVFTYYGHMGHADTKEQFISVSQGQRVKKGQQIGSQGNLSDVFPNMRNVHLHFTIYSGKYNPPWTRSGGPYNPCIYIGGNCGQLGERFTANKL